MLKRFGAIPDSTDGTRPATRGGGEAVAWQVVMQGTGEQVADLVGRMTAIPWSARWRRIDRLREETRVELNLAVLALQARDSVRAREVWAAFADSPRVANREFVVEGLERITPADRHLGVALWHAMLRDPDANIRGMAYKTLRPIVQTALDAWPDEPSLPKSSMSSVDVSFNQMLTAGAYRPLPLCGMTWQDVARLQDTFVQAESGDVRSLPSNILGALALASGRGHPLSTAGQ